MSQLTKALAIAGIATLQTHSALGQIVLPFLPEQITTRPFRNAEAQSAAEARQPHAHGHTHGSGHAHHDHGIESENLFGFTLGSDTEHAGARGVALETVFRNGKRDGRYFSAGQKIEFAYGVTDQLSVSLGLFSSHHTIRSVSGFSDVERFRFNGIGGEVRWRLLDRATAPFGLTLHIEPNRQMSDELTGLKAIKYGVENKLIIDRELAPGKLFGAINLLHEAEIVKEQGASAWERGSKAGLGLALTYQLADGVFIGGEARYLRAYEQLRMRHFTGDALFVGPTLFARFGKNAWISAAWQAQVRGHEAVSRIDRAGTVQELLDLGEDPSSAIAPRRKFDLANFERHQIRVKLGFEF